MSSKSAKLIEEWPTPFLKDTLEKEGGLGQTGPIQRQVTSKVVRNEACHQALPPNIVRPNVVDRQESKIDEAGQRAMERSLRSTDYLQQQFVFEPFNDDIVLTRPLQQLPQQLQGEQAQIMDVWINTALNSGWIQEVESEFPQVLLRTRIAAANRVTHDCSILAPFVRANGHFPATQLPQAIRAWARTRKYLVKIDLTKAFHRIPLAESQQQYYCFVHRDKYYKYVRMPMGAHGAPKHFHMTMSRLLPLLPFHENIRWYQDDIFVTGETFDEARTYASHTRMLLEYHGFKLNWEKSSAGPKIQVLGIIHDRTTNRMYIPDDKLQDIVASTAAMISLRCDAHGWRKYASKLLGQINFVSKFLTPHMDKIIKTLRQAMTSTRDTLPMYICQHWDQVPDILGLAFLPLILDPGDTADVYFDSSDKFAAMIWKLKGYTIFKTQVEHHLSVSSAHLEASGALKCVNTAMKDLRQEVKTIPIKHVRLWFDNQPIVQSAQRMMSEDVQPSTEIDSYMRRLINLIRTHFQILAIEYIPGTINPADFDSRHSVTTSSSSRLTPLQEASERSTDYSVSDHYDYDRDYSVIAVNPVQTEASEEIGQNPYDRPIEYVERPIPQYQPSVYTSNQEPEDSQGDSLPPLESQSEGSAATVNLPDSPVAEAVQQRIKEHGG
eukprot:Blabericola_migrator_1__523@NODE_1129_length_5339_cov_2973_663126_g723_i1_p1_GENE_NODE_1129_length_5339_cov_2973_663126_g723_i1NODE_1129_length_5339_cov_2973_663126_g723_i1_p1_ORF_typecomplete_len665_score86_76RVT_1/PF00078_27/5_3e12DNA_pol_viral_C/PF00336_18/2_1e03DNA_pol_viral_C/PF00336_18/0_0076_NODE_1129_length_5339_cov_2973_663126_g723_i124484442